MEGRASFAGVSGVECCRCRRLPSRSACAPPGQRPQGPDARHVPHPCSTLPPHPAGPTDFDDRGPPSRFDGPRGGGGPGARGPMRDRVVGGDLAYHASHGVAALLDAPLPPGAPADAVTHLLARRSRAELYDYLAQMQGLLARNPSQVGGGGRGAQRRGRRSPACLAPLLAEAPRQLGDRSRLGGQDELDRAGAPMLQGPCSCLWAAQPLPAAPAHQVARSSPPPAGAPDPGGQPAAHKGALPDAGGAPVVASFCACVWQGRGVPSRARQAGI